MIDGLGLEVPFTEGRPFLHLGPVFIRPIPVNSGQ
jgi:hypothetical protein